MGNFGLTWLHDSTSSFGLCKFNLSHWERMRKLSLALRSSQGPWVLFITLINASLCPLSPHVMQKSFPLRHLGGLLQFLKCTSWRQGGSFLEKLRARKRMCSGR